MNNLNTDKTELLLLETKFHVSNCLKFNDLKLKVKSLIFIHFIFFLAFLFPITIIKNVESMNKDFLKWIFTVILYNFSFFGIYSIFLFFILFAKKTKLNYLKFLFMIFIFNNIVNAFVLIEFLMNRFNFLPKTLGIFYLSIFYGIFLTMFLIFSSIYMILNVLYSINIIELDHFIFNFILMD